MNDYIPPIKLRQIKRHALARAGLVIANKGNPFWSRADALQHINLTAIKAR